MVYSLLAAASDTVSSLPLDPLVLGPIAGLVLVMFLMELIVPGRTYKRLLDDYSRARDINERVLPLAEKMVTSQTEQAQALGTVTTAMENILRILESDHNYNERPPNRRGGH